MTTNTIKTWRDVMARNDEAMTEYYEEVLPGADHETRANLADFYAEAVSA